MKNKNTLFVIIGLGIAVLVCGGVALGLLFMNQQADAPPPEDSSLSEPEGEESAPSSEPEPDPELDPDGEEEGEGDEEESLPPTPVAPPATSSEPAPVVTPPASSSSRPSSTPSKPAVSNLTIDKSGTNSTQETVRNLYIEATPAVIKNKTVTGDIIVKPGAGNGNITLENVRATGNIFLSGGGDNVTIKDTTAAGMVADRTTGTQTIKLSGQTSVPTLWAKGHVVLDETGLGNAPGVNDVYSQDGGRIWNDITLKGARLNSIGTSTPTNIITSADSSIDKVNASAQTHVAGDGYVKTLTASSGDVTYENKPVNVSSASDSYSPTSSAGKIGDDDYGVTTSGSGSSTTKKTYTKGTLATPKDLEVYVIDNDIYCSFSGDKNAKEGYTITPIIDGKKQKEVEVKGAGKGTPPEHEDVFIINNANSIRNRKVSFEVYANEVDNKYAPSSPARSASQTVYQTAGFSPDSLSIVRNTKDEYTISWGQVEFYNDSRSNTKPGGTTYAIDYTVRRANGTVVYQPTGRASTNKTTYKIPVMPKDLEDGAQIDVTVYAKVDTDSYPCTLNPELTISGNFKLGKLPTPTGLTATLPSSGYKMETQWAAVDGAKDYTVTANINEGGTLRTVSQTVTGTSHTFDNLATKGSADSVTALSFSVVANAPANSIYDSSQPGTSSALSVPIKLAVPGGLSIELLPGTGTNFKGTWNTVANAANYRLNATHYDKNGDVVIPDGGHKDVPNQKAGNNSTQSYTFSDKVGGTVKNITFTAQTLAASDSWYRDSDAVESQKYTAAIPLPAPIKSEMSIKLSPENKLYYTVSWGAVEHAYNYHVVPIYNGQAWTEADYAHSTKHGDKNEYRFYITDEKPPVAITSISFRVYALAEPGTWYGDSDFTDSTAVQVNQPMPTPSNISIELTDGNKKAYVRWNTVPEALGYEVIYYVENAPGSLEKVVVEKMVDYTNTDRTEFPITGLEPDTIRSIHAEVRTVPKDDSWNDKSPWSARASQTIAPHKLVPPISPSFIRSTTGLNTTLTVSWEKATSGHDTKKDQYAVWFDLEDDVVPDRDNAHYVGTTASKAFTATSSTRTHHIRLGSVPQIVEHNRLPSDVIDFYVLTGSKLKTTSDDAPQGQGILLPVLDEDFRLTSDPVVYVDAFFISGGKTHQRGYSLSYDGTAEVLARLDSGFSSGFTEWNKMSGKIHLELQTKSGRVYHTEVITK